MKYLLPKVPRYFKAGLHCHHPRLSCKGTDINKRAAAIAAARFSIKQNIK